MNLKRNTNQKTHISLTIIFKLEIKNQIKTYNYKKQAIIKPHNPTRRKIKAIIMRLISINTVLTR
ncbi:hypothetical protein VAEU17_4270033 [Vibrio aestuarianus]|nr:hypothetical protein VAEU17_4270033 [Vibrio aestuarianus]